MILNLFKYILLLNIIAIIVNAKYICTLNHTIELEADKIVFIESPNFPRPMLPHEQYQCSYYFTKQQAVGEVNKKLWIVLTNLVCSSDGSYWGYCISDMKSPDSHSHIHIENFTTYFFNVTEYSAFQGYAIYDDWNNVCPLQSISQINPLHLTDETQILYLWGRFNNQDFQPPAPCTWRFTAPWGYGFKVVVNGYFNDNTYLHFKIDTNNYSIATEKNTEHYPVFYTSENNLKVWFYTEQPLKYYKYMSAYVTIYKNQYYYTDLNCSISKNDGRITWSYYDEINGYPNNAKCSYIVTVKPNTEIVISLDHGYLEQQADIIYFYFSGNTSIPIKYNIDPHMDGTPAFVFYPKDYNTERNVLCEFVSDGSWNSLGFSMNFDERACKCGNSIMPVPCDNDASAFYTIMGGNDPFYCSNMNCTFNIIFNQTCSKSNVALTLQWQIYGDFNYEAVIHDTFILISDNITVGLINYNNNQHTSFIFSSMSTNILQINTVESNYYRQFFIFLNSFDKPSPSPKVILSKEKPFYVHSICTISQISTYDIELSSDLIEEKASIDFYTIFYMKNIIYFYNNSNVEQMIFFPECFPNGDSYMPFCKTYRQHLALLQHDTNFPCYYYLYNPLADRLIYFEQSTIFHPTKYPNNCVFKSAIIDISEITETKFIKSAMSNSEGSCKFFLLTDPKSIKTIKRIWTNPFSKGLINIYVGPDNKKLITIDIETIASWHDIVLYSYYYIIEIPKNTAIVFYFERIIPAQTEILTFPYFSLITSPLYGEKTIKLDEDSFRGSFSDGQLRSMYQYNISEFDVQFTLIEYNVSSEVQYYFLIDGKERIDLSANFKSKIFSNTFVEIFMHCNSYACIGTYDILLSIETLDNLEATTSTTAVTSAIVTTSVMETTTTTTESSVSSITVITKKLFIFISFLWLFFRSYFW